jgi:hypothetical protein
MRAKIHMDELWRLARLRADADLTKQGDQILGQLAASSPFALEDLTGPEFSFEAAVARVAPAA